MESAETRLNQALKLTGIDFSRVDLSMLEALRIQAGISVAEAAKTLGLTEAGWYSSYGVNASPGFVDSMIKGKLRALLALMKIKPEQIYIDTK